MCAIVGALLWGANERVVRDANRRLNDIFSRSTERGRDGRGWRVQQVFTGPNDRASYSHRDPSRSEAWGLPQDFFSDLTKHGSLIANLRAEPTTEYVGVKSASDQQPYRCGPWTIVHNGTIANDAELRTHELPTMIDSAAIVENLARDHMRGRSPAQVAEYFEASIRQLKGSYAILATHDDHPDMMLVAANYRPIWFAETKNGVFFASARHYFPSDMVPQMIRPYSAWAFGPGGPRHDGHPLDLHELGRKRAATAAKRALVVCSGGLDSVVAATWAKTQGYEIVTLLHFRYGSRAEGPEERAIWDISDALSIGVRFMNIDVYSPDDSPLLRHDSTIAGGEAGAEFAHEWVPARNLVMLSMATAIAEAAGFDHIILGNNLEEAGAYPDNEPEFIARFNDLLPFAVGDGKRLEVIMPVGNLMKHEIVALGHQLGAPLDKTWSCYRAGEQHCGTCGPCFMRRTAFEINGLPEVITYANEGN